MKSFTSIRRCAFAYGLAAIAAMIAPTAQSLARQTNEEVSYIGVVKGNDVYVRSNAAETYYPFGKVNDGDLVKVTGEKYDWARIATIGPAFREMFGYVKYLKGDNSRMRLSADGKTGVTLGKIDIIAPNLAAKNSPKDSWKPIAQLEADQTLQIIGTVDSDKDMILKVTLPATAQGWINTAYLEKASEAQVAQWKEMLAAKSPPSAQDKPTAAAPLAVKPVAAKPSSAAADEAQARVQPNTPVAVPAAHVVKPTEIQLPVETDMANTANQAAPASADENPASSSEPAGSADHPKEPVKSAERRPKGPPAFDDLEAAFKVLQKEPAEIAEVSQLRELYLDFAKRSTDDEIKSKRALGRADQLQIWSDVQKKRLELGEARARLKMSASDAAAVQKALESSAEYVAVGRVVASPIYDGQRLPKLLRLQDPATNRTIAYLQPDEQYTLVNLVGNLVGIVGEKSYDESLRLNIIVPKRVDVLTPDNRQAGG